MSFAMSYVAGSLPIVMLHTLFQLTMAPCSALRHFSSIALWSVGSGGSFRKSHPEIRMNSVASLGSAPPSWYMRSMHDSKWLRSSSLASSIIPFSPSPSIPVQ